MFINYYKIISARANAPAKLNASIIECHTFRIACDKTAMSLLESGEQSYMKALN